MAGRPSKYSQATADVICARIAKGESLRTIAKDEGMPDAATVYRWLAINEPFREQYARAREEQADFYAEECIQIADDGRNDSYKLDDGSEKVAHDHIQRSRLRVDARKWYASKLHPKKYGEKLQQEVTGAEGGPVKFVVEIVKGSK